MRTPKQKTSAQKRYEQLKSRGLCVACGKVPAQPGKTKCIQNGPNAIHRNHDEDLRLKKWAQRKAMEHYGWPEEKFRQEFGRSYL